MTTRNVLLVDLGAAILVALLVLALTPGLAVSGTIAMMILIACGISLRRDSRGRNAVARRRVGRRQPAMTGRPTRRSNRA